MVFIDLIVVSPELHLSTGAETQASAIYGYGYAKDSKEINKTQGSSQSLSLIQALKQSRNWTIIERVIKSLS